MTWTPDERRLLRDKRSRGAEWIARRLHRTVQSVRRKAQALGIKTHPTRRDYMEFFDKFPNLNAEWYAAQLGVSVRTVYYHLRAKRAEENMLN